MLASVSHDANCVSSGNTAFLRSTLIEMKCNMTFLVNETNGIIVGIM